MTDLSASPQPLPARADVVVIGAGLAGLAAALALAEAGADVQVVEASQRVGGRVLTLRAPFADGLYAEAGAEFISTGHQVLRSLLQRYRIGLSDRSPGPRLFYFRGRTQRGWSVTDYGGQVQRDAERIEQRAAQLTPLVPDPARPWDAPATPDLDRQSLAEWLDLPALDPIVQAHRRVWTTIDYGVEPERLSLLMYARDECLLEETAGWGAVYACEGLDHLPRAMAAELGGRVHLGARVAAVEQGPVEATVQVEGDGGPRQVQAHYVVVALPLTLLRALAIDPPLEPEHRQAIEGLGYGHVLKVHLQFRHRFWREAGVGGVMTDLPFQSAWDSTHAQPGRRGILTVYTAGEQAVAMDTLSEEERIAGCLEQLEALFPGCDADFERGVASVWDVDPAEQGAYSYFGPGQVTRYGPWLSRPVGRLHFAGEYADPWQATMNGALASGQRAAREVLARLKS